MRRRYVLALVICTALVFLSVGYYLRTLRDDGYSAADCEAAINYFETIRSFPNESPARAELLPEAADGMVEVCTG